MTIPRTEGKRRPEKSVAVGLARALSKLGYCSRSKAMGLIREGKVQLNGAIARNPLAQVRMGTDRIKIGGQQVSAAQKVYLMMNKPRGIVTTAADEKGRDTVYSLLPKDLEWIAPVGRLDQASEGLLLLTNDSEWGARITDPQTHLNKTYHVQIGAVADENLLNALLEGVVCEGGEVLRAKKASVIRLAAKSSWIAIVLDEGKNRQIRRMLEGLGAEVLRLIRVAIGEVALGDLAKGSHRTLRGDEKQLLDRAIGRA